MPNFGDPLPQAERQDYFDSIKEWSKRKLDVLEKYTDAFARIKKELYCVDGFAGRGEYLDGNPGSPRLTAEIAKRIRESNRPYWLKCINVEKDVNHFAHLSEITEAYPEDVVTNYGPGEFGDYVSFILKQVANYPAFFFLDPFGIDGLQWLSLLPVLKRSSSATELLINFNVRYVPRLAGHIDSQASSASGKTELLTSVLGTDEWKRCMGSGEANLPDADASSIGECIRAIYERQLRQYFPYVYHYPVCSVDNGQVRYYLIFATRSPKGVVVMSDILCGTEDQYQNALERRHAMPATQASLFEELKPPTKEEIIAARADELRDAICEVIQQQPLQRITYMDLRCALADRYFAKVFRKTYGQELKVLRDKKLVTWGSETKLPEDSDMIIWLEI